jgi:hypothetical protein
MKKDMKEIIQTFQKYLRNMHKVSVSIPDKTIFNPNTFDEHVMMGQGQTQYASTIKLNEYVMEMVKAGEEVVVVLNKVAKEVECLIKSCPLVSDITMLNIGERSKLLGEHCVQLDEWYHKLKQFSAKFESDEK